MNAPYIVNTLKTDATKQEEIDFLNAIAAHVEAGTYLSQLLTPAFISWTTTQIKNDFSPDAFGFYQQEAADHETTRKAADAERMTMNYNARQQQRTIDKQADELIKAAAIVNEKTERLNSAYKVIDHHDEQIDTLTKQTEAQAAEITALKARLYDLLEATK
jgi:predicted RNase H-like nuclease (RuvC/YqgF family)